MIARVFAYSFLSSEVFVCTNESDIPGQVRVELVCRVGFLAFRVHADVPGSRDKPARVRNLVE